MIQKIKMYILTAMMALTFAVPALVPTMVASAAGCSSVGKDIATGAGGATGSNINCDSPTGVGDNDITKAARGIVRIFSIIVGVVAVIMIIYGGFRYITSGGDSNRVGAAKNSLIYAIIGLIIVALAQLIVHFVLNQTAAVNQ